MITDIPTADDFKVSGLGFLNLAWSTVIDLHLRTEDDDDFEPELEDQFWGAAQRTLANATSLLQQGIEFLLKARIVEASPFLLIDGSPRDWPKGSATRDVAFSEFRTIDAQDLVKVHDTISASRLDQTFVDRVNELRRVRNSIMHTVDKALRILPHQLLRDVLDASHNLLGERQWITTRREYMDQTPESVQYSTDANEGRLVQECDFLARILDREGIRLYLGMNPSQRWYICPNCAQEAANFDVQPRVAQLRPNTPDSQEVYCFVCDKTHPVVRVSCAEEDCKGNVVAQDGTCLTCFMEQAHPTR